MNPMHRPCGSPLAALTFCAALASCSASGGTSPIQAVDAGSADATALPSADADATDAAEVATTVEPDAGADVGGTVERDVVTVRDAGNPGEGVVMYAHSADTLYAVNPHTNALTRLGAFTFPSGDAHSHAMNDVAVAASGALVGNTPDALYRIDPATAACALVAPLPDGNFVGLTYLPVGLLPDATGEALVGGTSDGALWRIDDASGRATRLGQLRRGTTTYTLSGDLVSIAGAGTFATVRAADAAATSADQLASVNPASGALTLIGSTGFRRISGLAYYLLPSA